MRPITAAIRLLRPKQWAKNLLVFAALIFTGGFSRPADLTATLLAFAAMCLASSATYVFNDIQDVERDRLHPKKAKRPLAAGELSVPAGAAVGFICLAGSFALAASLNMAVVYVIVAYLVLQVLYNVSLKRTPIADVYCIAMGFVLRAGLGAAAIHVAISAWLFFCTAALALMLGFGKRRNEFILLGEERASTRQSLVAYNRAALDALVILFATASSICYALYTIQSKTADRFPGLVLTTPFVVYGIARYLLLVFTVDEGGEPEEILFKDPHLVSSILLFLAAAATAMSGVRIPLIER